MSRSTPTKTNLTGAAGEYYVVSRLLRRGLIASLAPAGAPNTDVLVTHPDGERLCTIQVKTRRDIGADRGWHMSAKHEQIIGDRLFYCFVDLGKTDATAPTVFVLPSKKVAEVIKDTHIGWLKAPGKNGRVRKDGTYRRLIPDYTRSCSPYYTPFGSGWMDQYFEAWHLLELD